MAGTKILALEPLVRSYIARNVVHIPPYPGVVMKLNRVVQGGKYGTADLVKVVSVDPVIAAALLRSANSASVRGGSTIATVGDAVARLGSAEVVRVAMAASLGTESAKPGPLAELRRKAWQESLISAVCCMQLAPVRALDVQEAFVCGLLHDFGRLIAIGCLESILVEHKDARTMSEDDWLSFVDLFHVELGSATAQKWNLAPVVRTAISSHHKPDTAGNFRPMVDLVIASDAIVALLATQSGVQKQDLEALSCLSAADVGVVLALVPQIPPFLAGLAEATGAPKGPSAPSQVTARASVLDQPVEHVNIPGKLVRAGGDQGLDVCTIAWKGFSFVGPERLAENYLSKIVLQVDGGPLELWAHVLRATPVGMKYKMEAKLFALNGPAKERWYRIVDAMRAAQGAGGAKPSPPASPPIAQ